MKYMGSKNRLAKYLLPILLENNYTNYIEPFVGGANIIDKVPKKYNIIGADSNKYLIAFLQELQKGKKYKEITKEEYIDIKKYKEEKYSLDLVGYAGFCASYSGKWFGGFAGIVETKGGIRNYQKEAINNIEKQDLNGITFICTDYKKLKIPKNSIIYCDPPYANTTSYKSSFNHTEFWHWCREKKEEGHIIFVSEYNAPEDFRCIWQKEVKSSLSANGISGGCKKSIEKLFTL